MVFAVLGTIAFASACSRRHRGCRWPAGARALGFCLGALFEILAIFLHPKFYQPEPEHRRYQDQRQLRAWLQLLGQPDPADRRHGACLMRAQQTGTQLPGPLNNMPKIGR